MHLKHALKFLLGNADSIRKVASEPTTLLSAALLVVSAAFARNYDQTYFLEKPFLWLFGPLIFSFFTGTFVFLVILGFWNILCRHLICKDTSAPAGSYRCFLGLFWMTAPLAYFYAIPVERFFDPVTAAKLNVGLLAVVALWRVLLMARIVSVVTNVRYTKCLGWTLVPSAIEAFAVTIFGGMFAKSIMAAMSGIRNAPSEEIVMSALGFVFVASPCALVIGIILALTPNNERELQSFPKPGFGFKIPFWVPVILLVCTALSYSPQKELQKNYTVSRLLAQENYRGAIDYLSEYRPEDFAPSKRIPPDPYEYEILTELPGVLEALDGTEAPWVRDLYLGYFKILLGHSLYFVYDGDQKRLLIEALKDIPDAPEFISENRERLSEFCKIILQSINEDATRVEFLELLEELGIEGVPEE